jgi:hypothetical protein
MLLTAFIPDTEEFIVVKDVPQGNLGDEREDEQTRDYEELLLLCLVVSGDPRFKPKDKKRKSY